MYGRDEAVAESGYCFDERRVAWIIAELLAEQGDGTRESCLLDKRVFPDSLEDGILLQQPAFAFHQKEQNTKGLGLKRHSLAVFCQAEVFLIKFK